MRNRNEWNNMTKPKWNEMKAKTKCAYCGKKGYSIFISIDGYTHIKPRNLKDFYYCRKHGIQRMTRKVVNAYTGFPSPWTLKEEESK